MRTTLDLPDDLMRQAKAVAALRGMKLRELIASFIEQGLGKAPQASPPEKVKRKLPKGVKKSTGKPIRALSNAEIEALILSEELRHAS